MQCLKSQTFFNSCTQNRHDILAKIGKHINGTSGAEHGCNMDWTLDKKLWEICRNMTDQSMDQIQHCEMVAG